MMRVRLVDTIEAVDSASWDSLGGDPLSTHAVLRAVERAALPGVELRYATVEDADGRLAGAAPLARIAIDGERLTHGLFRWFIHAARTVRPGFLRTTLSLCGTPLSVGNPPVRIAPHAHAAAVLSALARAMVEHAKPGEAPWLVFKEFGLSDRPAAEAAFGNAHTGWLLAPSEPNAVLPIEWSSYEAYLASLRSDYRYKIRKAARQFARAGCEVSVAPLAAYDSDLHRLYEAVLDRAAVQLERLTPAFFVELGKALGDRAWLLQFHCAGRVIGWVAMLLDGERAYDLFHGIDYRENVRCALYFNQLAEVIRCAIERGVRQLSLGQSTETSKARFGARPVPLWIALRHRRRAVTRGMRAGRHILFPTRQVPTRRVFREAG